MPDRRRLPRPPQRGVTVIVTLVLLMVMLLGGLALVRMTEVGTLSAGNTSFREAAVQASEVGVNSAYAAVLALTDEEANAASWYSATTRAADATGLPTGVDWAAAPQIVVGNYDVRYVVDRQCTGALPIADPARQCLTRTRDTIASNAVGIEPPDPPTARLFRITVRVTGPKDTTGFVQVIANRG